MKSFLVIGLGRFGASVAQELSALGQEVLALDIDAENVQYISDQVTQAIQGDAQDEAVLRSVGARNFDCELNVRARYLINVLAIRHGEGGSVNVSPAADQIIGPDDVLIVIGTNDNVNKVVEMN